MERRAMLGGSRAIVGERAPSFTCNAVVDGRIKEDFTYKPGNHSTWTILIFFPMAWSFICPTEILAFDARKSEFHSQECNVYFVSCDSEHVLKAWNGTLKEEGGLGGVGIPLLSDRSHRISRDYGILCEEEGYPQRAVFIIDKEGIIKVANVNDAKVGRSVDEVKRLLEALKFVEQFGEGCPVDWRSGQKGIRMAWKDIDEAPEVLSVSVNNGRPGLSRGSSWSAGWGKVARPRTWAAGGTGSSVPNTPPAVDNRMSTVIWAIEHGTMVEDEEME